MTDPTFDLNPDLSAALFSAHGLPLAIFVGLLAWAGYSDATRLRIPNTVSLALAGLFPAYAYLVPGGFPWLLAAIIAMALLVLGIIAFAHGLIGGGDAKMLSAVALWAGPEHVLDFLMITALAGGVLGVAALISARFAGLGGTVLSGGKLPYGVAIAAGGLMAVVVAPSL